MFCSRARQGLPQNFHVVAEYDQVYDFMHGLRNHGKTRNEIKEVRRTERPMSLGAGVGVVLNGSQMRVLELIYRKIGCPCGGTQKQSLRAVSSPSPSPTDLHPAKKLASPELWDPMRVNQVPKVQMQRTALQLQPSHRKKPRYASQTAIGWMHTNGSINTPTKHRRTLQNTLQPGQGVLS